MKPCVDGIIKTHVISIHPSHWLGVGFQALIIVDCTTQDCWTGFTVSFSIKQSRASYFWEA